MTEAAALWTPKAVGDALIDAFRALPSRPCMSRGGRLVEGSAPGGAAKVLNAVMDAVPDDFERQAVLTWARCRATGESWSERCRLMGWPRQSARDARIRALRRVVRAAAAAPAVTLQGSAPLDTRSTRN